MYSTKNVYSSHLFLSFPELSVLHHRQVRITLMFHYNGIFCGCLLFFTLALLKTKCSRFNKRENKI